MVRNWFANSYVQEALEMPLYNTLESADELFRAADESFAALKRDITSAEWARIGHGEAERRVGSSGRNVLLCLYQCFLTLRALAEPIESVVGSDGITRTHIRSGKARRLRTTLGTASIERTGFGGRHLRELHPVDADLNLPPHAYSHEMERAAVLAAVDRSFESSSSLIPGRPELHSPSARSRVS